MGWQIRGGRRRNRGVGFALAAAKAGQRSRGGIAGAAEPRQRSWGGGAGDCGAGTMQQGVCHRFISEKVKELVKEAVEKDAVRKRQKDPTWVARDWVTLRRVVQGTWT